MQVWRSTMRSGSWFKWKKKLTFSMEHEAFFFISHWARAVIIRQILIRRKNEINIITSHQRRPSKHLFNISARLYNHTISIWIYIYKYIYTYVCLIFPWTSHSTDTSLIELEAYRNSSFLNTCIIIVNIIIIFTSKLYCCFVVGWLVVSKQTCY